MMQSLRFFSIRCCVLVQFALAVLWSDVGLSAETSSSGGKKLLAKYPAISARLLKNQFAAPIYLESFESKGSQKVDMYGIINFPFSSVRDALQSPASWCDITSLHTNIKACTTSTLEDQRFLNIYSGRKYYQPPADAYRLKLKYRLAALQPDYLDIALSGDDGPLHTKDHRIGLEAAPLDKGRTFIHFSYAYSHGPAATMAIKSYFATLARDKVGFSVVAGENGAPVYIGGIRGSIERNAVRYYLALQTFLDTRKTPEGDRFEQRIGRWYDLTSRYPRQLDELAKPEYLAGKRREHLNQLMLQKDM